MIRSALFRKHFAIAALSVLGFAFLGSLGTQFVVHRLISQVEREHERGAEKDRPDPATFFARLIDSISPDNPEAGMRKLEQIFEKSFSPMRFALLDAAGKQLYQFKNPELPPLPEIPAEPYVAVPSGKKEEMRGPGPRGLRSGFIRLASSKPAILYFEMLPPPGGPMRAKVFGGHPPGPEFRRPPGPPRFFFFPFLVSVAMILCGISFALYLIFRSLREHVATADHVISELQAGNLKARFPIRKNDEIGRAMERFNLMASEIEKLVEKLRSSEQSRNFLLQELTHDLRTPVASLRNLLDTIFSAQPMKPGLEELADLSLKEVDYVSRLVEDLLLLAQVSEPKYKAAAKPLDLVPLLEEEGEALALRFGGKIQLSLKGGFPELLIPGDERLMKRLVRNALENAFSFARSRVEIAIAREGESVRITVADDGPGFSAEALQQFGERRSQRMVAQQQGRLSLGLGSVIMKTITKLHRGSIVAANRPEGGGMVEILLPLQ